MIVVAGLGNPGLQYASTRHNVGFMTIDALASRKCISVEKQEHDGKTGSFFAGTEKVLLVKPQTYMNDSGRCLRALVDYYDVPLENLIVIYDDIDLEPGRLRIRKKGGAGTHNGMRSIVSALGSGNFPRIRIGTGQAPEGWDLADYVLARLHGEDEKILRGAVERAADAVELILSEGLDIAMNRVNIRTPEDEKQDD